MKVWITKNTVNPDIRVDHMLFIWSEPPSYIDTYGGTWIPSLEFEGLNELAVMQEGDFKAIFGSNRLPAIFKVGGKRACVKAHLVCSILKEETSC